MQYVVLIGNYFTALSNAKFMQIFEASKYE